MTVDLNSNRKVRTRALATPREWQRLAKECLKVADESQHMGDYETARRWRELSRALDPVVEN